MIPLASQMPGTVDRHFDVVKPPGPGEGPYDMSVIYRRSRMQTNMMRVKNSAGCLGAVGLIATGPGAPVMAIAGDGCSNRNGTPPRTRGKKMPLTVTSL